MLSHLLGLLTIIFYVSKPFLFKIKKRPEIRGYKNGYSDHKIVRNGVIVSGGDTADSAYIGLGLALVTSVWSIVDARISAKNINKKAEDEYGHLIKFGDDRVTLGIDPAVIQHNGLGTLLTVHF